jgi:predicted DNA-binding transcriptional regulator YafY
MRSALRKVLAVAPPAQATQAAPLMDRVRLIGTGSAPPPPAAPRAIQEAITARHVLLLSYRDRRDVLTCRMVVAYLTDPNGSLLALFSPRPEG